MDSDYIRAACSEKAGCWVKNGVRANRYGTFRVNGKCERAHRVSWHVHFGEIPDGLYVCHRCNNKPCCNPGHLYLGTHKQNMIDAGRDGLMPGAKTPRGATLVNAMRKECNAGHPFTDENTYRYPSGKRACKACRSSRTKVYQEKNIEAVRASARERARKRYAALSRVKGESE